jgi:transmembrane sensor
MENSTTIEQVAAAWLARRDREPWDDAQQSALSAWLNEATAHRVAFIRLEAAWERTRRLKALGAGVPRGSIPKFAKWLHPGILPRIEAPSFRRVLLPRADQALGDSVCLTLPLSASDSPARVWFRVTRRNTFLAVAVCAVLVLMMGVGRRLWWQNDSYRTDIGGLAVVTMKDGSQVTLNTNSAIHVTVTPTGRRVDLLQGEALFDVAKESTRRFVVVTGDDRVVAVGTRFSVRRDTDHVLVMVAQGRVRVGPAELAGQERSTPVSAGDTARLADDGSILVETRSPADVEKLLSWRFGFVMFHETALGDVVAELNRYNRQQIVIDDPTVNSIRIGGTFRWNNMDGFVRLLQEGFPIRVERRGEEILLKRQ